MSTDLNIRILSSLNETQHFLLYQQEIKLNVKNYKIAAWEHQYIAPGAKFTTILPMSIGVKGRSDLGKGSMSTKELEADYDTAWEIYDNQKAIDIKRSTKKPSGDHTIDVYNETEQRRYAIVTKDSKSLFACEIRPGFKVNFAIKPKIYFALSDLEIIDEFFDAATLSSIPYEINYEGQSNVTIYLKEDLATGEVMITHDFKEF